MYGLALSSLFVNITFLLSALASITCAQTQSPGPEPSDPTRPIDIAFDVQPDSFAGGCTREQKNDLSAAFDEMIQIKNLISIATGHMSDSVEQPATGWMFNYLFAIPSSQENQEYGEDRDSSQVDYLLSIWTLMDLIGRHSSGELLLQDGRGIVTKTRIYCSSDWIIRTKYALDSRTNEVIQPRRPLNGGEHWYDSVTKIAFRKQTVPALRVPDKTICGADNLAVTHLHFNTITFCPLMWDPSGGDMRPTLTSWDPPTVGVLVDKYQSFSKVFLHEYTHLVGRIDLNEDLMVNVESADRGRESVGYFACNNLASNRGAQVALKNADSYAVLGVALFLSGYDWRDGTCQTLAHWEASRGQSEIHT